MVTLRPRTLTFKLAIAGPQNILHVLCSSQPPLASCLILKHKSHMIEILKLQDNLWPIKSAANKLVMFDEII